jgi:hypothetical protein
MQHKHCHDIHHNLAIDYDNGHTQIGPCCQSGRVPVQQTKIDLLWENPTLRQLRDRNRHGELSEDFCNSCILPEAAGITSRRIDTESFYRDWPSQGKGIRSLDIRLSNLCNLKCCICGAGASTAWVPDAIKLGLELPANAVYDKNYAAAARFEIDDPALLRDLEMIKFWGGEPLINEDHAQVLRYLDEHHLLSNCRAIYNTNATYRVSQEVLDLWSRARLVELYFSIDDVGSRFDHQRSGASWEAVLDNLEWYRARMPHNHLFYIMTTVSWYNLLYLPELVAWKNQFFSHNRFGDEVKLCLQPAVGRCAVTKVSEQMHQLLINRYRGIAELEAWSDIYQVESDYQPREFCDWAHSLDRIRGTRWPHTFPELASAIDDRLQ